jgi:Pyruvate/2-oxoacid:ferredoxin oxidoreductase delta subunit
MKNKIRAYQIVLFEGHGAVELAKDRRSQVTRRLLDLGYSVTRVGTSGVRQVADPTSQISLLVLGDFAGNAPQVTSGEVHIDISTEDITGLDVETILDLVEKKRTQEGQALNSPGVPGAWKPWFPVIDYDRCTNCMQCLSFCLFDVYGVDEQKQIQVQNNDNCKTNCPACSRVCPEVAIMFPKYSSGPINGAEVVDADVAREKMKVDITSLLGGDIYSSLRTRSEKAKSRFSKERSPDKALDERKRCLTKLQQSGIIPLEVLAELDLNSLPSPEEIQRKARELSRLQDSMG